METTSMPNIEIDSAVLELLQEGCLPDAILRWLTSIKNDQDCKSSCLWGGAPELVKCATCLEGRLRSLSLAHHEENTSETLTRYARALNEWSETFKRKQTDS